MRRILAVCVCGGMLALALSMTPALALNPQPLPPCGHHQGACPDGRTPMIIKHPRHPHHHSLRATPEDPA